MSVERFARHIVADLWHAALGQVTQRPKGNQLSKPSERFVLGLYCANQVSERATAPQAGLLSVSPEYLEALLHGSTVAPGTPDRNWIDHAC